MESATRHDLFEANDRTALICVDDQELHNTAVAQLTALGYKIHTGLFLEDISLKLKMHAYDLVLAYEHFHEADVDTNQMLAEVTAIPTSQRRNVFVVLVGPGMVSDDQMQAFRHSVDFVVGMSDLPHLKIMLPRAIARRDEFYRVLKECVTMTGM